MVVENYSLCPLAHLVTSFFFTGLGDTGLGDTGLGDTGLG